MYRLKLLFLCLCLGGLAQPFAQSSGLFAFRGQAELKAGNYANAQRQYEKALDAAIQEGHALHKAQILSNLTRLYIDQFLLIEADSLLSLVDKEQIDPVVLKGLKTRISFLNSSCKSDYTNKEILSSESPSKGTYLFWANLCNLSKGTPVDKNLLKVFEGQGMKNTLWGFQKATEKDWQAADSLWTIALEHAREAGRFSTIVDLLWYKAWAAKMQNRITLKNQFLKDSFDAAALSGLPLLMLRAGREWLKENDDETLNDKLNQIEEALSQSLTKELFEFPKF